MPLVFNQWGEAEQSPGRANPARTRLRKALTLGKRLRNFIAANPLRVGLPGGAFKETVNIGLQPGDLSVSLRSERHLRRERDRAGSFRGRLFAEARSRKGVTFFAVPDDEGSLGMFGPDPELLVSEPGTPEFVTLSSTSLVLRDSNNEEGEPAGWQVG